MIDGEFTSNNVLIEITKNYKLHGTWTKLSMYDNELRCKEDPVYAVDIWIPENYSIEWERT